VIRDTKDILPETVEFFKMFQRGSITAPIIHTSFNCKITVDKGMAVFDILKGKDLFCTNFCCFSKNDKQPVMLYIKGLIKSIYKKPKIIREPQEDMFIYTFIVNPLCINPNEMMTAGEIELYVYDAIRRGLEGLKA